MNKKIFIAIVIANSVLMFFACNRTAKETKVVAIEEEVIEEVVEEADEKEVVKEIVALAVESKPAPFRAEKTISYTAKNKLNDGEITFLFDLGINGNKKQISQVTISIDKTIIEWVDSKTYIRKPDKNTFYGYDIKVNDDGSFSQSIFGNRNINGTVKSGKIVGKFINEDNISYSFTANP